MFKFVSIVAAMAFASVANAADTNLVRLAKQGAPELYVSSYLSSPSASGQATSTVFADIQTAFTKAGWLIVNDQEWEKVPEATKQVTQAADQGTRCTVVVRGVHPSNGSAYIQMECGPANSYNNGVYVRAEFNNMTSPAPALDGEKVPNAINKMYARYTLLQRQGLNEFSPTPNRQ